MKGLFRGKAKDNSRRLGIPRQKKELRRFEAEERNKRYQALTHEEKLTHHSEGGKAWTKLMKKETERIAAIKSDKK